jgi:antitoxin component of MazEF toxin-antitoxin module
MPRRESGKEHIRKLQRTGAEGRSYSLTLPKGVVKKLGWQERQKLVVKEKDGKVVISDWEE